MIDPLLLLWKAYANYLKIEFSFYSKDNMKYMEYIHSIIRDLERAFSDENESIKVYSLYFIGCFYYKINDIFAAKEKLKQCVELCKVTTQTKPLPELLKVYVSACELLDNIWTYQIKPTWWRWWLNSPVHPKSRKYTFWCIFILIFGLLFIPILGGLYPLLGPISGNHYPLYVVFEKALFKVTINWTLYLFTILLLVFIWLFPCIERIKGKDFEIEMSSPLGIKFELYPVTPPKKEPSVTYMEDLLLKYNK